MWNNCSYSLVTKYSSYQVFCKFMHGARQINVRTINLIITKKIMSSLCMIFCNNLYKNSLITYPSTKTSELLSIISKMYFPWKCKLSNSLLRKSGIWNVLHFENASFWPAFEKDKSQRNKFSTVHLKHRSSANDCRRVWPIQSLLLWYLWGQPSHAQHMLICRKLDST